MELARVVGTVVSSHKAEDMVGLKLSLVENVNPKTMKGLGSYAVAIDDVGANTGEIVFYVTGSSARFTEAGQRQTHRCRHRGNR